MKNKILLCLLFSLQSFAGSFADNGADRKEKVSNHAWFLGTRNIHWCSDIPNLSPTLNQAADIWSRYIVRKRILTALGTPVGLTLQLQKVSCTGREDLKIMLKTGQDESSLSSSTLEKYDPQTGWGHGRMELHPKVLQSQALLLTQLLHQIGHILGCEHIQGTIMDEEFNANSQKLSTSIDGTRELFLCKACDTEFKNSQRATYQETGLTAILHSDNIYRFRFDATLGFTRMSDSPIFRIDSSLFKGQLFNEALSRTAVLEGSNEFFLINRNFGSLIEIRSLQGTTLPF